MKARLLIVCLVVCSIAVVALWPRSQPRYQGRPLSLWLVDLNAAINAGNYDPENPARQAMRHMGTNALPELIRYLRGRDSLAKQLLMRWAAKQNLLHFGFKPADELRYAAVQGYEPLGALATEQVPALTEMLETDPLSVVRQCAASALGMIGTNASVAAPALLRATKSTNDMVRCSSLWALSRILPNPNSTVPTLIAALDDPHQVCRENAAIALGNYGPLAKAAVPALIRTTAINRAAGYVIKKIDPDGALKAGVPAP